MTNREKYAEQILNIACQGKCIAVIENTNKIAPCNETECTECLFRECVGCDDAITQWCNAEYIKPTVDWSKVPVDTPIMVRDAENAMWHKEHFARVTANKIYAWVNGKTSWTTNAVVRWNYAKLTEESETE